MSTNHLTLRAAQAYRAGGLSPVPVRRDGSKAPAFPWGIHQKELASPEQLAEWFDRDEPFGIGIVGGAVSGGLEHIDFDQEAEAIFPAWCEQVEAERPGLIAKLSIRKTPREPAGYHVSYRCTEVTIPGNDKLAQSEARASLVETRGEGGYVIVPGSPDCCHPSGRPYVHHSGPKLSQVQTITAAERATLIRCARMFDRSAAREYRPAASQHGDGGLRPGDDYNRRGPDWAEILGPAGWTEMRSSAGKRFWRRPGKTEPGASATTGCTSEGGVELLCVFSSNAHPFPGPGGGRNCSSHSKFDTLVLLQHNGDHKAAAQALMKEGYGDRAKRTEPVSPQAIGKASSNGKPPADQPKQEQQFGIMLCDVKPQQVSWLWAGRVPLGKLTILDGDPGLGKSTIALDLAARVSRGWPMPMEQREAGDDREPAGVLLLTAEDGLDDTVVPRIEAAGGDRSRILALDTIPDKDGSQKLPSLPADSDYILAAAKSIDAKLIVCDPLMAYLGGEINSHRDQDCRRALWPLAKIAEETGAAVLVVRHLNKMAGGSALHRGGGSIGISGAARSVLLAAKDPDFPDTQFVLASTKSNLGKRPASLSYAIDQAITGSSKIRWIGESLHSAEGLVAAPQNDEDRGALAEAMGFLRDLLAVDAQPAGEIRRQATQAGISMTTLNRAKALLGVEAKKIGFAAGAVWKWHLPPEGARRLSTLDDDNLRGENTPKTHQSQLETTKDVNLRPF